MDFASSPGTDSRFPETPRQIRSQVLSPDLYEGNFEFSHYADISMRIHPIRLGFSSVLILPRAPQRTLETCRNAYRVPPSSLLEISPECLKRGQARLNRLHGVLRTAFSPANGSAALMSFVQRCRVSGMLAAGFSRPPPSPLAFPAEKTVTLFESSNVARSLAATAADSLATDRPTA